MFFKRNLFVAFIVLIFSYSLWCQGFDWQYSARMPSKYPRFFGGINAEFLLGSHFSNLSFLENDVFCSTFGNGMGESYSFGLNAEYWFLGDLSFCSEIRYRKLSGSFSVREAQPRVIDTLLSEYNLLISNSYLDFGFSLKKRINDWFLFWGAGLNFYFLLDNNYNLKEIIIKPDYFPWKEREITSGKISELNSFVANINLMLGYDFDFGMGKYVSVIAFSNYSLNSLAKNDNWKNLDFGIKIKLNFDLKLVYFD